MFSAAEAAERCQARLCRCDNSADLIRQCSHRRFIRRSRRGSLSNLVRQTLLGVRQCLRDARQRPRNLDGRRSRLGTAHRHRWLPRHRRAQTSRHAGSVLRLNPTETSPSRYFENSMNLGVSNGIRIHDNRNHNLGTYAEKSITYGQFVEDSTPLEAAPVLEAVSHLVRKKPYASTRVSGYR